MTQKNAHKTKQPQRTGRTPLILSILTALPPLIIAIVHLLETGRKLGWW